MGASDWLADGLCRALGHKLAQATEILAAASQLQAIVKLDDVAARFRVSNRANAIHGNDCRAVYAHEFVGVELVFCLLHRSAGEMRLLSNVKPEVIVGSVDPVDIVNLNEVVRASAFHYESLSRSACTLSF